MKISLMHPPLNNIFQTVAQVTQKEQKNLSSQPPVPSPQSLPHSYD
ncbi:MAG TPA: hypothetical protein V6D25_29840 [Leptolyngbyaceae cyanobacterium]